MIADPLTVIAVLLSVVLVAAFLGRLPYLRSFGGALIAIILGALLSNLGIMPTPEALPAVYDPIFGPVTQGAIFLVLLEANLRALKKAGAPMLIAFALGAAGTMAGVLAAAQLVPAARDALGANFAGVGGMLTGTYIGGGANFNAIAIEYGVIGQGIVYTATVVVDNVMTALWIAFTIALAPLLARSSRLPRRIAAAATAAEGQEQGQEQEEEQQQQQEQAGPPLHGLIAVALPIAVAALALILSRALAALAGGGVPMILILTTIALIVAQVPFVQRVQLARPLGMFGLYLFLAAVGTSADLGALLASGALGGILFAFVAVIFAVHLLVLLGGGALLRLDPDVIAIASSANIGGATTAIALAEVRRRDDLVLPGLLVGALGTALGTYAGLAVALLL